MEQNKLNKLLVDLICDPRQINCADYPKNYFIGTMLQLVTKTNGYYWKIFNKQRIVLIEKLLKDGANPNQNNCDGVPLIFCSLNPYQFKGIVITELLLKYGCDPSVHYDNCTLLNKINKKYTPDLLSLLIKYDYVIVEVASPFTDHIVVENVISTELEQQNTNWCYNLCCFV